MDNWTSFSDSIESKVPVLVRHMEGINMEL